MPPVYPDAMREISLNQAETNGGIVTPPEEDFNTEAMQGSMQQFLADNLGSYVVIEFLIGTQNMVYKRGILYSVGRNVVTLYEEESQTFVLCDIFSVKFVTFYLPGQRPGRTGGMSVDLSSMSAGSSPMSSPRSGSGGCRTLGSR